ncbi:hypothetical protein HKX48_005893 [Thoreauomyces humboldtii]|nr:hypothetical protein HKX48_005893 [Thoreauomyces humboldtii]
MAHARFPPANGATSPYEEITSRPRSRSVHVVLVAPKVDSGPPRGRSGKTKSGVKIISESLDFRKHAQSRVGSLENIHWTAPGGQVQIFDTPVKINARSKVGSLANIHHRPAPGRSLARSRSTSAISIGGSRNTFTRSAENIFQPSRLSTAAGFFRAATAYRRDPDYVGAPVGMPGRRTIGSKIGSLDNIHHRAGGGDKKIKDEKIPTAALRRVSSRVGSLENIAHVPGGGHVQIIDVPVRVHPVSKIGSRDNIRHKPLGGHVSIVNDPVLYLTKGELASAAS